MPLRLWLWVLIVAVAVVGCEATPSQPADSQPSAGVAQVVRQMPEDVVQGFMQAWNAKDITAMYSYVSAASRAAYPFDVFTRRYQVAQDAMGFASVSYTIHSIKIQGQTAVVSYDATLQSPVLKELKDPNRIMRLTQVRDGWQIAWTPMDILNGLASEVSVQVVTRPAARGNIYDRNGAFVVEEGGTIISVSLIQQDMRNTDECIDLLAIVLKRERIDLVRVFAAYNAESLFHVGEIDTDTYTRWRRDLEDKCGTADESAGYRKIESYSGRSYTGHGSAVHITGYIGHIPSDDLAQWLAKGYQASDIVGIAGIEKAYEDDLAGKPERFVKLVESGGVSIRELGSTMGKPGIPVQLTIDMRLQNIVAQALIDAHNYAAISWASRANGAAAVVMKVDTGEILALASYPFFDPSLFNPESSYQNAPDIITQLVNDPRKPLANKAIQEQYTPGSVYKIFTAIAADNNGIYPPDKIFNCELTWTGTQYGDEVAGRQDWRVVDKMPAAGPIIMPQALTTSCNPFFWEMGGLMYKRDTRMHINVVKEFGFGATTGLEILGSEAKGNLAEPKSATEAINNAIGQGSVQITAVQLATAVTAVANKGTLYRPYIVKQVGGMDGTTLKKAYEPVVVNPLKDIKPEVFDVIHQGMCNVPIDKELGTSWVVFDGNTVRPSYTSCGKTGTAETGDAKSGRPPNAWYVAFAPADKPEIVVVVVVPTSREGSEVAAPIVRRILDDYFNAKEAPFFKWWTEEYNPVAAPEGVG